MIHVHFSPTPPHPDGDVKMLLSVVPREGEVVSLHGAEMRVRTVVWYPQGDEDSRDAFVYVVLRQPE